MCMYSYFYPLVNLKNGKRKVLFDYPVEFSTREDFDELIDTKFRFKNPIMQDSMYNIFKRDDIESFDKFIQIPCGECYQCKKERTQSWAFRILQEAKQYKCNYFLTLTYNEENCPKFLIKDEISKFNKKLKVYLNRKGVSSDFRFFGCGEYGSKTFRL